MSNSKNYDSAFCGSLPLHQINLIQPHGYLIVLDRQFKIIQVSENCERVTGKTAAELVNTPFADYISAAQFDMLRENSKTAIRKIPLRLSFLAGQGTVETVALVNTKDNLLLIELEIISTEQPSFSAFTDVYQQLKFAMAAIAAGETTTAVCEAALTELKKISGFDKIMIYQFDKDWNGTVIAEKMEPGMDSYLGLVFPASDIPKQARQLYINNPYRLIPDVSYSPAKLYPLINPLTNGFLDLSDIGIRAVPSVHLEYMRNMGISASMSTRILNPDNTLWGLISCHHLQPKFLNYEVCTIFELMSTIISARIAALKSREEYNFYSGLQQVQAQLLKDVYAENDLISGLTNNETNLLQMVNADSVAIVYNKRFETLGQAPGKQQLQELVFWLKSLDISKVYYEESLSDIYEAGKSYADLGSGILVSRGSRFFDPLAEFSFVHRVT